MKIEREQLIKELESVSLGLSKEALLEQSDCFVFRDGTVMTFNEEIGCRTKCCLGIQGAIRAKTFLAYLHKLPEATLDIGTEKGKFYIHGAGRGAKIIMERHIHLPIDAIKLPEEWKPLPDDFLEAINRVRVCAGTNVNDFITTCLHIHPNYIEACDNMQAGRYEIETGLKKPILVRSKSIVQIVEMGVDHYGKTKNWIHFKNPNGLIISCRQYSEKFLDLDDILKVKGKKMSLPKALAPASERSAIFSAENSEDNRILIRLSPGCIQIRGSGSDGTCWENQKAEYKGKELAFRTSPDLINFITKEYKSCRVSNNRMKINVGKFTYITVLGKAKKKKSKE